jgi:Zn-dependent M28 family amino/carboxypeptidase
MHRPQTVAAAILLLVPLAPAADFSGASALEFTRQVVEHGPRPPGSAASRKLQGFLIQKLRGFGWEVIEDPFTARTPDGPVAMKNIIARKRGASGRALVVTGHYDTKKFPFRFVGANDAGSSTGLLLELARVFGDKSSKPIKHDLYLVFFDGEEAFREWSREDGIHGSRHLADKWAAEGLLSRIVALINVDMIGDRDLQIVAEAYSSEPVRRLIWQAAADLGYSRHFLTDLFAIEDDHVPFLRRGVRAVDLIDFSYGPNHSWWHTPQDTMDKLSASSLEVTGRVVAESLRRLSEW